MISEHTATNAIPTTDRQSHTNKSPFDLSSRPATDPSPPATRTGPNAHFI